MGRCRPVFLFFILTRDSTRFIWNSIIYKRSSCAGLDLVVETMNVIV